MLCVLIGVPMAMVLARWDFPGLGVVRSLACCRWCSAGGRRPRAAVHLRPPRPARPGPGRPRRPDRVLDDRGGVAQTFVALPFLVLSLEGALRTAGQRYEAVAASLGARPTRSCGGSPCPWCCPGCISGAVLSFARALGEFGATITFAGSLQGVTRTLPLEIYLQREIDPDAAVALARPRTSRQADPESKYRAECTFVAQDGTNEIFEPPYFGRSRKSAELEFPRPVQVSRHKSGASMMMSAKTREKGFALIGVSAIPILLSAMAVTLSYTVRTEKRIGGSNQEGNLAYYDAEAGMEKMTADLGALYEKTKSPSAATISALGNDQPTLPDVGYKYVFNVVANPDGSPQSHVQTISAGDFAGLSAQIIPINLDVTATRVSGAQAHMTRDVEVAQIPVFQFGVFSDSDSE